MYQKENASCKKCKHLLFDYVSDNTTASQSQWLNEHLAHCPSCQKEYEEIRLMLSVLQEEPEADLPVGFQLSLHRKLVDAVQEKENKKAKSWMERIKDMPALRTIAPALVCLVLVLGVFTSGLFEDWKNSDSVFVNEPKQVVQETQMPTQTPVPTMEEIVPRKPVVPKQTTPITEEIQDEPKPVPAVEPEPVTEESVQAETAIMTAAEPIKSAGGGSNSRAIAVAEDALEDAAVEVSASYLVTVSQTIISFLEDATTATNIDWLSKAECVETTATLRLSESEWELLCGYMQSLNLVPTLLTDADGGTEITVTIQGVEG